jgi:hypothetical protein
MQDRLFVIIAGLFLLVRAGAAQHGELDYQVKAAFLLNFTKFTEWPATEGGSSGSAFKLCVVGEDPLGPALEQITPGETVNGRKLVVVKQAGGAAKSCQMVYFEKGEGGKEVLSGIAPGVLTVGEGDVFLREGGMIAFVRENRRVRFMVNLAAARNGMVPLSSKLLAVATAVEK